jgi:hypothetical protein
MHMLGHDDGGVKFVSLSMIVETMLKNGVAGSL